MPVGLGLKRKLTLKHNRVLKKPLKFNSKEKRL
jgi:hypothetical protein